MSLATTPMKRYPFSNPYPIDQATIKAIAENMRQNGYDPSFPILIKDGAIVDGYHRSEAARIAGVLPTYQEVPEDWTEKDILLYVMRANGDRRHLNEGQKAATAILIKRRLGDEIGSVSEVAASMGVKEATLNRFLTVDTEVLNDIASGATTQKEARRKFTKAAGSKGGGTKPTIYTLSTKQQRTLGSLGPVIDKPANKIMAEAMDLGFASLELAHTSTN